MEFSMVNSSSLGSERNGDTNVSCMQSNNLHSETQSSSPLTATSATHSKNGFTGRTDGNQQRTTHAVEPTPSQTDSDEHRASTYGSVILSDSLDNMEANEVKRSLFCSVPLEKVQTILSKYTALKYVGHKAKIPRKILCLYCDRTFVNTNLRQKHVERCHSSKQLRRVSLRNHQNFFTCTPCIYCDKFTSTEHTLKDLFKHLIENHSHRYFGCLSCEDRFLNSCHLADHNALHHNLTRTNKEISLKSKDLTTSIDTAVHLEKLEIQEESPIKITRKKQKPKNESNIVVTNAAKIGSNFEEQSKSSNKKSLRSKKLSVKTSRMILKRSKRLQAKVNESYKKKRAKDLNVKKRHEQSFSTKLNEKSSKTTSNFVNPYPEFDNFFQVKKITDHSIDNLKISSLTFDDVFDKAFFNKIKCNIQENLLHHIDGKLFKNEESESRISNFEKNSISQEVQNVNTDNYGCELSLNAIAPTTLLLSSQFGDDPELQIEYGSKPSKKKTQMKKDEVHYKYFTRRKYQASILEHKENRDLSKLDMWTQYVIKNRQQKIIDDKKSPKEILDYFSGEEYKSIMRREELNRILDRRGPFEDLREEVSKRAALDKLNGENSSVDDDNFVEIGELLNDILNRVFDLTKETYSSVSTCTKNVNHSAENNVSEIPSYLNLRPNAGLTSETEIDRSDKIALICSSQETENFELPSNTVRGKNEKVELTGEWARSRIYVCAACGLKLQNIKQFLEHKSASHQYIWVQHYEFVGNQSELYRHLSIPVLGKVGVLENVVQCKVWKRSDARLCTKCGKQCNSLGELHRHILECGGDWTWMLARKKCKYRPFGAKSRRKRRGLVKRIYTQKTQPSEKKIYKKSFDLPRQKPSDADTIKRMLANLPPKRATRKIMSLKDGFNSPRNKQVKTSKQSKFKCGKLIHGKTKEPSKTTKTDYEKNKKNQNSSYRRSLRCLNKVLTSRILDTNSSLILRRKYNRKVKSEQRNNLHIEGKKSKNNIISEIREERTTKVPLRKLGKDDTVATHVDTGKQLKEGIKTKRCSPRIEKRLEFNGGVEKMNIKRFFPIKKKKNTSHVENVKSMQGTNDAIKTTKSVESSPNSKVQKNIKIKSKEDKHLDSIVRNLNLRKRKFDIKNTESAVTDKNETRKKSFTAKTRKLRTNRRSVMNKLNSLQSNASEPLKFEKQSPTEVKTFFDDSLSQGTINTEESDEIISSTKSDGAQSLLHDDGQTKSDDNFETAELNLDKDLANMNVNSITTTLIGSEKAKRKLRKPARGLNDCIAMLTSKLGKNFEDSTKCNIFNEISQGHQENVEEEKADYILKVPFFNEHFQLHFSPTENEQLKASNDINQSKNSELPFESTGNKDDDLNTTLSSCEPPVSLNDSDRVDENITHKLSNRAEVCNSNNTKQKNEKKKSLIVDKICKITSENFEENLPDKETASKLCIQKCEQGDLHVEHDVVPPTTIFTSDCENSAKESEVLISKPDNFIPIGEDNKSNYSTDSEDEVPLSTLLKDDQVLPKSSNEGSPNDLKIIMEVPLETALVNEMESRNVHKEKSCDKFYIEPVDLFNLEVTEDVNSQEISNLFKVNNCHLDDKIRFNEDSSGHQESFTTKLSQVNESIKLFAEEDATTPIEVDDNFYTQSNTINCVHATILEDDFEILQDTNREAVDDKENNVSNISSEEVFQNEKCDNISTINEVENGNTLEERCKSQVISQLEDENALTEANPEVIKSESKVNVASTGEVENDNALFASECIKSMVDSLDCKENSLSSEENVIINHKSTRETSDLNASFVKGKLVDLYIDRNTKENAESLKINRKKKAVRTTKTKALESILDDALLELTENELFVQANLKNGLNDDVESDSPKVEPLKKSLKKQKKSSCSLKQKSDEATIEKNDCQQNPDVFSQNSTAHNLSSPDKESTDAADNIKELRRSRRNSKKVTYNETDLVDPLLDDLDSNKTISKIIKETTQDIFGVKRKNRKLLSHKIMAKDEHSNQKLNGDELFDLLKATPSENIVLSKPTNTFFNTFDEISDDFNDDNFDVLEDILEKSMAVIEENLSEQSVPNLVENLPQHQVDDLVLNFSDSKTKTQTLEEDTKGKVSKKKSKKIKLKNKSKNLNKHSENKLPLNEKTFSMEQRNSASYSDHENVSNFESLDTNDLNSKETSQGDSIKNIETDKSKVVYCEICNKFFCRMESLTKHKRTLTHISKLSELEAKEAALKTKCDPLNEIEESELAQISSDSRKNLDLLDILENMDTTECKQFSPPFSVNVNNSNLKLADIINDVLNKPMLKKGADSHNFAEIIMQSVNETQPEIRRYKSLAERKSFESDNCLITTKNDSHLNNVDYFEPEISNAAAGTILEKQITLLENIIENRSSLSYIDELSVSSSQSVNENLSSENDLSTGDFKQVDLIPTYLDRSRQESKIMKSNLEESFLKPTQYEEISEDSNLRNYDEQKSRKVLNRDEELFLECCSLLKSGSEVSSYSKKSNKLPKDLHNLELKSCEEPDWLENNCSTQKKNPDFSECCSDNSRIRTPLGDGISQDDSDSATISSQWDMNNSSTLSRRETWKKAVELKDKTLTFEEVFSNDKNKDIFCNEQKIEELEPVPTSFDHVVAEDLNSSTDNLKRRNIPNSGDDSSDGHHKNMEFKDATNTDGKKMLTKGAMKIFEGLKVSIPTEELNIDKILICGSPSKTPSSISADFLDVLPQKESNNKTLKSKKRHTEFPNKSVPKTKPKNGSSNPTHFKKQNNLQMSSKIHDIYDFEETQDNSDVFTRPDFRSFRNNHEKSRKNDKPEGSDDDSRDCTDAISFDAFSSSASSVSELIPAKPRTQQNITKKKCMIMGRIFKNAVKSRTIDEDMRNIPVIDNTKLVEDFVLSCAEPVINSVERKPKMTEEEMNLAFDNLINTKSNESKQILLKTCSQLSDKLQHKNNFNKRKPKAKSKKRSYGCSDSSDDEFKLQKTSKKRPKKKSGNTESNCINLEQELRECIGVASRKSQRKCTSGKQNVLIEYWSSDESSFEAIVENPICQSSKTNHYSTEDLSTNSTKYPKLDDTNIIEDKETIHVDTSRLDEQHSHKKVTMSPITSKVNRRKRAAVNPLYHWSSSSEDESRDLIEVRPIRDEIEDDEDRPIQHGWIVGDSPKKLVTMLAQAKGKKSEVDGVKEHGKKRTSTFS